MLLSASFLLFMNLGNIYLWQDEAETALLAKNILTYGYPRAWDGKNIITQNAEKDFNEHYVWTWSPWLQLYITAGSFLIFGVNTFSARFPFALIGVASVIIFYLFTIKLTGNKTTARVSTTLMVTSIPFLLHARQCRWYMPAIFSTIWMVYAYLKLQEKERNGILQFTISSLILFHSSYLTFLGVMGGTILHYLYCLFIKLNKPTLRSMMSSFSFIFLFTFPWIIYTKAWAKSNPFEEYALPLLIRFKFIFIKNVIYLNNFLFPVVFIVGIFWLFSKGKEGDKGTTRGNILLLFSVICFTVVLLSAMPWIYFRYLIGLVPLCSLLLGLIIGKIMESTKILALIVLLLLIFTNVFSLILPPHQIRFDFLNYFYEITHDYDGPNEGIVKCLKEHGNQNQFLKTNYGQLPIIFYTNMRAVGFSQDLSIPIEADWIIIRKGRGHQRYLRFLSRNYQAITIDYPDIPWGNRPDPFYHKYRTVTNEKRLVIYKKP